VLYLPVSAACAFCLFLPPIPPANSFRLLSPATFARLMQALIRPCAKFYGPQQPCSSDNEFGMLMGGVASALRRLSPDPLILRPGHCSSQLIIESV